MKSGRIIKLFRTTEGLSQIALAESLGVSRTYLSQVENERKQPSMTFLNKVSEIFNVPLPLLLVGEGTSDPQVFNELSILLRDFLAVKLKLMNKNK